eukprot:4830036-Alexandrium_andersonii.AAC.1
MRSQHLEQHQRRQHQGLAVAAEARVVAVAPATADQAHRRRRPSQRLLREHLHRQQLLAMVMAARPQG